MLVFCEYGGTNYNCSLLFDVILTDDGACCIFNAVHSKFLINYANQ